LIISAKDGFKKINKKKINFKKILIFINFLILEIQD